MRKTEQTTVQEEEQTFSPLKTSVSQVNKVELYLRKIVLAALTMLGIGYVLVNAAEAFLMINSVSALPIASQANISAIGGRILVLMASMVAVALGVVFIFGAVKFYEQSQIRGIVLLGVLLGSFYLLCLGVGSTLLLSEINLTTLMLITASIITAVSAAMHTSPSARFRIAASFLGIAGGVILGYAIFNFRVFNLVFSWDIPFTGPFMSLTVLDSAAVIVGSVAACASSLFSQGFEERPFTHLMALLVALVYGVGIFVGSLVLSMSIWDLVWKSPWAGPLFSMSGEVLSTVVFWSASLVLMDIGGILLMVAACLGFVYVAQEFSQLGY